MNNRKNMSNFNTLVKTTHLIEMKPYFKFFEQLKYNSLNYDTIWKWSGILDAFFKLYGAFSQIQNFPMLIARFVFKKF